MPPPALLLVIATLVPLASFLMLVFLGKRMGNPLAGYVGTLAIGSGFVLSIIAMMLWLGGGVYFDPLSRATIEWGAGKSPINLPLAWIPAGIMDGQLHKGFLDIGLWVDSLTIVMFTMVTLVSTLVHIFSIGYMREDRRFARFFTYLNLFCFSMLGLVIGGTLLQLFIFWELVGLCSYLLIGFWYEKKSASNAAIKAFVVNRIGDFGFLIGFGILFYHLGNASLFNVWKALDLAGTGHAITLSNGVVMGGGLLTIMGIGLFCGAIGKSAQFPLHVWLPDAMEGPTPVSALIHAATMVAAGVYLVGRIFPILTPDAKLFIAIIGCTTLTMAALIAIAQSDIKKVLAYSTLSQLGYMILAMGVGSWVGGLFHLITHAFFKALLFLGSGSVIFAAHHEQELPQYGGLLRKIPVTAITFAIAVLAIAGTPFFAGHYSKDLILTHAGAFAALAGEQGHSKTYRLLFYLPVIIAYVTAFYMMRCWTLTFWGKPRNQHLYDHAHEAPVMWMPLVALAVLSIIGGYNWFGVSGMLDASITEARHYSFQNGHTLHGFDTVWPTADPQQRGGEDTPQPLHPPVYSPRQEAHIQGVEMAESGAKWAFLAGIALAFLIYRKGYGIAQRLVAIAPLGWIHTWLYRKMYFDELYYAVFLGITMGISRLCGWFDKLVVDGLVNLAGRSVRSFSWLAGQNDSIIVDGAVNGSAQVAQAVGFVVRVPQTGRIRMYVTVFLIALGAGLATALIIVLYRTS